MNDTEAKLRTLAQELENGDERDRMIADMLWVILGSMRAGQLIGLQAMMMVMAERVAAALKRDIEAATS